MGAKEDPDDDPNDRTYSDQICYGTAPHQSPGAVIEAVCQGL